MHRRFVPVLFLGALRPCFSLALCAGVLHWRFALALCAALCARPGRAPAVPLPIVDIAASHSGRALSSRNTSNINVFWCGLGDLRSRLFAAKPIGKSAA